MTRFLLIAATLVFSLVLFTGCASAEVTQDSAKSSSTAISEEHEYSVEIEGSEMKKLTIKQIADMWGIDAQKLLDRVTEEFKLQNKYTTATVLDELRNEYKFSPAMVKDIAENIKKEST